LINHLRAHKELRVRGGFAVDGHPADFAMSYPGTAKLLLVRDETGELPSAEKLSLNRIATTHDYAGQFIELRRDSLFRRSMFSIPIAASIDDKTPIVTREVVVSVLR
ncbi:MAG TPA: hypothetical protein VGC41_11995, partial [Kofleriaceae bacterium]